jgi:hypothetical protein
MSLTPRMPPPRRRHMMVVSGGAAVMEGLFERLRKGPYTSRALEAGWWLCERAHDWSGRILLFAGRWLGRVIRPIPWPARIALLALITTALAAAVGFCSRDWVIAQGEISEKQLQMLADAGLLSSFDFSLRMACVTAALLALAVPVAFVRLRLSWHYLRLASAVNAAAWLFLLYFIVSVPSFLFVSDGKDFTKYARNELWVGGFWLWIVAVLPGALLLLSVWRAPVRNWYTRGSAPSMTGDAIAESLLTNGPEPTNRTSIYWSSFTHLAVLFIIPLLLRGCGMQEPYGVPQGTGLQTIQVVQVKQTKKQKPKKRYFLNPNSPISFFKPDIDQSMIREKVEDETQDTYQVTSNATQNVGLGKGGPGKGGWPHGMADARVRFIRLKYDGGDWDQDMGVGADHNILVQLQKICGFKIAENTEAISITALRKFPKHRAPPFVFITGAGDIRVSGEEVKALRWYCIQEGGMIFADNGGGSFNGSFRALMKKVFPELEWIDIANDDVIFRQPFLFPNGAPPLWHHSGYRALGMKQNERWVVFYHQGDLNDAWKNGHNQISDAQAQQAYKIGINVINYAFNQYMAAHYGD